MSYEDGYLPGFTFVQNDRNGGSSYDPEGEGYPWRIVLHTTESDGMPNVAAHPYPPHIWVSYETGQKLQTVPCTRGAFALYQSPTALYYTNRARALQCEIVGRAAEAADWPDAKLKWIAENVVVPFVRFARAQGSDVDLSDAACPLPGVISGSASEFAPQRLDPTVWAFGPIGVCGHRHVPMGDDHWDAGGLDMRKIAAFAREILGGSAPSTPVDAQPMRRMLDMEANLRRKSDGTTAEFDWLGYPVKCWAYDLPLVPAGSTVAAHPSDPEQGDFNAQVIVGGVVTDTKAAGWGRPAQVPVKSSSFVTVVVPRNTRCRVVAV